MRPSRSAALAALLDAGVLLLFAALGRRSHGEGGALLGLWQTAWPFLAGAALGWLVVAGARRRAPIGVRDGVVVWVATVAGGMAVRTLTGAGTAPSFVVVATVVTGVLLLGRRVVGAAWSARRAARSTSA
ncbi:DUF3054 domain-containing protein [Agilicoccus flavus]|uniref:DUF3054 domain-containing protein n=1 Tax=Agilicoccus flavus TaxID=2775968 RepID=UPI001CF65D5B|nr:DUF3054 domain-containing protein [Agilicoccus flavus]